MSAASIHALPRPSERRSASAFVDAVVIAALVAAANFALWSATHPPLTLPDGPDRVHGVAFSGYQRHQDPTAGLFSTEDELAADLDRVATYADRVRTYSATENAEAVRLASMRGLRVTAGAWLDRREENNEREIAAIVRLARENPNVDRVIVGNESILRGDLSVPALVADITRVKRKVRVPVSTAEPWHVWLRYPELARHVDFITVHLLPYWEGVPAEHAVDYALARYAELRRAFPKKRIVIGEIGWPSRGDRVGGAIASPAAQAAFVRDLLARTADRPLDYYLMEMFDQPWKQAHEGRAGAYWGMHHADRTPKFALDGPVEVDARWRVKALAASLVAAPLMLWFAFAFRRLRATGRMVFCALIQGAVAALVWLATIPLEFYLGPADWVAIALLVPAAAAMLAVLLANGFEFVEVLWRRGWRREFRPLAPAALAHEPFVSIHLPACNEPPEMVILTLDSLARLDYRNFEVIVVDNNTRDERLWRPVEAHCAQLGARFRFYHLPEWPGFKAGALNFALRETDPRAEVIGVVDADYAVDRGWLARLAGHFADAAVAVVQAPQAHRDFEGAAFRRMANWEFDGFFRIGMHHRNERNAIIQHGTMTLVRRHALDMVGGWAEWCICEDAELGLRLMQAGHDVRYVDAVLGRGLTPADFGAFKVQRFRWAFGAMQILKRHLARAPSPRHAKRWPALSLPHRLVLVVRRRAASRVRVRRARVDRGRDRGAGRLYPAARSLSRAGARVPRVQGALRSGSLPGPRRLQLGRRARRVARQHGPLARDRARRVRRAHAAERHLPSHRQGNERRGEAGVAGARGGADARRAHARRRRRRLALRHRPRRGDALGRGPRRASPALRRRSRLQLDRAAQRAGEARRRAATRRRARAGPRRGVTYVTLRRPRGAAACATIPLS